MKIQILNRSFTCQVNRSKRKTVQIKITAPNQLLVSAPLRIPISELEKIVMTKSGWIVKQAEKLDAINAAEINSSVSEGAQILYLGKPYILVIKAAASPNIYYYNNTIEVSCPPGSDIGAELHLKNWYITSATAVFKEKTSFWAPRIGVIPNRITIKDQKTRWGSCSSQGNITFNWRVVMAPPTVIDYLVIHELAHMLVPNHSAKFWHLVETFLPDYKTQRKWLKDNGRLLSRILNSSGNR